MMRPSHKIIYTLFISFVWHHHKVDGLENEFVSEDVQSQLLRLKEDIVSEYRFFKKYLF